MQRKEYLNGCATSYVILSTLLNLSELQIPYLRNEDTVIYLPGTVQ